MIRATRIRNEEQSEESRQKSRGATRVPLGPQKTGEAPFIWQVENGSASTICKDSNRNAGQMKNDHRRVFLSPKASTSFCEVISESELLASSGRC